MSEPQNKGLPIIASVPRAKDPVCGMTVDPQKPAAKIEFGGTTYNFCSKGCAGKFEKEPQKYLPAHEKAVKEDLSRAGHDQHSAHGSTNEHANPGAGMDVRYTCPMHPQIVQMGPGSCPICGMALEPMDAFAEVEADPEYDSMLRRFWVSAVLSLPVLLIAMFGDALRDLLDPRMRGSR